MENQEYIENWLIEAEVIQKQISKLINGFDIKKINFEIQGMQHNYQSLINKANNLFSSGRSKLCAEMYHRLFRDQLPALFSINQNIMKQAHSTILLDLTKRVQLIKQTTEIVNQNIEKRNQVIDENEKLRQGIKIALDKEEAHKVMLKQCVKEFNTMFEKLNLITKKSETAKEVVKEIKDEIKYIILGTLNDLNNYKIIFEKRYDVKPIREKSDVTNTEQETVPGEIIEIVPDSSSYDGLVKEVRARYLKSPLRTATKVLKLSHDVFLEATEKSLIGKDVDEDQFLMDVRKSIKEHDEKDKKKKK